MKVCQNCKQTNPMEAMFCRQCASPLGAGEPNQPPVNPPNPPVLNQPNNFASPSRGASGRAMAAVGLAALSPFCCGLLSGIPAAILGWLEIQAIKEGKSDSAGMGYAQIGMWGGIIGGIIGTILGFIFFLMFLSMNSNPYGY